MRAGSIMFFLSWNKPFNSYFMLICVCPPHRTLIHDEICHTPRLRVRGWGVVNKSKTQCCVDGCRCQLMCFIYPIFQCAVVEMHVNSS